MLLAAAALVGATVALVLIGHLTGRDQRSVNSTSGSSHAPHAQRDAVGRRSWVAEANAVCRLGRKLYPNIALGAGNGDPDTMNYAVNRLVGEIGTISGSRSNFRSSRPARTARPIGRAGVSGALDPSATVRRQRDRRTRTSSFLMEVRHA
jgi:hypothetical protein